MPGPAKKPALQVVREGNPGKRPIPEHVAVPPAEFDEPDWSQEFPASTVPPEPVLRERDENDSDSDWEDRQDRWERQVQRWELLALAAEGADFCRARAGQEWVRSVPVLKISVGLGNVDFSTVVDMCVCVARLEWCERRLSVEGLVTMGQRGPCRNPLTTVATQYRTQLKTYIRELGLSPSARTGVPPKPGSDDDDSIFD